jgi:ectoine hydroxylase-related dioxygenase (phytanoyl-CoA dioxygenase family)
MADMSMFVASLCQQNESEKYPHAEGFEADIPIYDGDFLRTLTSDQMAVVKAEWVQCWQHGAGIFVVRKLFDQISIVDAATQVFYDLLHEQNQAQHNLADHFAAAGANSRIWNCLEKMAVNNARVFIDYYKNPLLADVCTAWLGPEYQLTSQVNLVHPGGASQQPHRDYHLGFTTDEQVQRYPPHVQVMSSMLTLQGAVAHIDMPVESGPTLLLPYSQRYEHGYALYRNPEFIAYFAEHAVQVPLDKGDGMFFNPALMHGAGANTSVDVERMANLLQISSAFGKPMESIDQQRMQLACYDDLNAAQLSCDELAAIATALSDSYPFSSNMDRDSPLKGLRPLSGRDVLLQAVDESWTLSQLQQALQDMNWRKASN